MKKLKFIRTLNVLIVLTVLLSGCQAAVIAGAGAGGYYVGKDERDFSTIISDGGITTSVNSRLLRAKGVKTFDIDVDTHEGVVTLKGTVPSKSIEQKVLNLCKETKHVKRCISKLTIKDSK